MDNNTKTVQTMDYEKIKLGNTTFIVRSNAPNVPKAFVKKAVERMIFSDLKQKT